jgi:hypothetical protein
VTLSTGSYSSCFIIFPDKLHHLHVWKIICYYSFSICDEPDPGQGMLSTIGSGNKASISGTFAVSCSSWASLRSVPLNVRFISFQPSTASLYFSVLAVACNECFIIFAARIIVVPIDDSVAPVFCFFRSWSLVEVLSRSSNMFIVFWAFCFYFGS